MGNYHSTLYLSSIYSQFFKENKYLFLTTQYMVSFDRSYTLAGDWYSLSSSTLYWKARQLPAIQRVVLSIPGL